MIAIKTQKQINVMAQAGQMLAQILRQVAVKALPGVTTKALDEMAEKLIEQAGAGPGFKGHDGYPATLCTSINEEIVHMVPSKRLLKAGDILSLDIGLKFKGFFADMAVTIPIGEVAPEAHRLIRVTKKALKRAIKKVKPGKTVGDIGNAIERVVKAQGFSVVEDLVGHGIGQELHEEPEVPNVGKRGKGLELKPGMVLAIEPMVALGRGEVIKVSGKKFGRKTKDGKMCAHFEHTVAVTEKGCRVLTSI